MKNQLNEDGSVMNYNKWVKGIADREFGSSKLIVNDLFKNQDQHPNSKRTNQNNLPYPLSSLITSLGTAILNLKTSISQINVLKNNPLVNKSSNLDLIELIINDLKQSIKHIEKAANNVDNL